MINQLLVLLVRLVLRLRYQVHVTGAGDVATKGSAGILFLPNHPGLIDPVILMSQLYSRFHPRPLADQDQVNRPGIRWLAARLNVVTIPDPNQYGEASRKGVEEGVVKCVEALHSGGNLLLYPSGHIMRRKTEDLAGSSAVETILKQLPGVRVVLIRTRGIWGSGFSRATGMAPPLGQVLKKGILSTLANGLFFSPRRKVTIELYEPEDLPRQSGRAAINRYLEAYYNQDAPASWYVPYTIWEKGGAHELPEPACGASAGDVSEVPAATRDLVIRHLREVTGRSAIGDEDSLSRDLNLDSLALVDLGLWIQSEFGFQVNDGSGLATVGDVLLAARGLAAAPVKLELKPIPEKWFSSPVAAAGTRMTLPPGSTLTSVFLAQAGLGPDRVVLADQLGGVKTYRDVITGILALRPLIKRMPGDYIGIMLPASAGAGVLFLATLFAGKTPVMVNWTVGERAMTHSLDLLGVRTVLTAGKLVQKIESQSGRLGTIKDRFVMVEALGREIGTGAKLWAWLGARSFWRRILSAIQPSETAVVLFTSGSENLPKAVPLTHGNLLTNLRDLCRIFAFGPSDRLIGILPPFHSFGLSCTLLLPVCGGVPVAYHPNPTEGAVLARLIAAYRITLLVGTPTFLNGILRGVAGRELDSLRVVITGAEKCPESTFALIRSRWPDLKVVEGYGITECSPVVSANDENAPQPGTIGKVLPSVEYVLQDVATGQRVAPGGTGLLLVRGPSIFSGYLNYDGDSPFVEFEGKTWYRTGDLVYQRPDGVLVFAGRLKRFVKLGGEMISLPAIEEALARFYVLPTDEEPVLAVEATPVDLNPELVLFTLRDLDREEVNNRIKEAGLSALHNIRLIRKVETIPLLGSGKIDYRTLKDLLRSDSLPDRPCGK